MGTISASKLRSNIYRILDGVLETGVPVEIERNGRLLRIIAEEAPSRLAGLDCHDYLVGDPEAIVQMDWSDEWRP